MKICANQMFISSRNIFMRHFCGEYIVNRCRCMQIYVDFFNIHVFYTLEKVIIFNVQYTLRYGRTQ